MNKIEKKKSKMKERIEALEQELKMSLQKKGAGKAIDVPSFTRKIQELKVGLTEMK